MKVENVIISVQKEAYENIERLIEITNSKNINLIVVNKGQRLNIEKDLYFDILWPDKSNLISENSINNNSLVFKLNYKNFSCLFTGDIEKLAEEKIFQEYEKTLKSTVLKVPHHGSKTSSTLNFVKAVSPKISLIGVGEKNKFGHPDQDVIERLKDIGSKILRTDKNGEIIILVSNDGNLNIRAFSCKKY